MCIPYGISPLWCRYTVIAVPMCAGFIALSTGQLEYLVDPQNCHPDNTDLMVRAPLLLHLCILRHATRSAAPAIQAFACSLGYICTAFSILRDIAGA